MRKEKTDIDSRYWKYMRQGVALFAVLFFAALFLAMLYPSITLPAIVSVVYALVLEMGAATAWRKVATNNPDALPTMFMAVSGGRFMLALVVMFVYFLLVGKTGRGDIATFIVVFAVFYLATIIHHALFFTRKSKAMADKEQ